MIYLCRHGQTFLGEQKRKQGHINSELTLLSHQGYEDAKIVASKLNDKNIEVIYTSPLLRTIQTTKIIMDNLPVKPKEIITPELIEISFGKWEGLTEEEIDMGWPGEFEERKRIGRWNYRVPGGESYRDVSERVIKWWDEKGRYVLQCSLLVSHNVVGMCLRKHVYDLTVEQALALSRSHKEVWELK